ncbi:hypothetical protein BHE74_00044867 [Ensete ventricosum]|nr:hypothetical protein BHE74_00044867 [Ensete ventricosum]
MQVTATVATSPHCYLTACCHSRSQPRHHPLQQSLPLLATAAFPSFTTEITLSHITTLLSSSFSLSATLSRLSMPPLVAMLSL